jgi:hypothetical protein
VTQVGRRLRETVGNNVVEVPVEHGPVTNVSEFEQFCAV